MERKIIDCVCEYFGYTYYGVIRHRGKGRQPSKKTQVLWWCMYFLTSYTFLTQTEIGKTFEDLLDWCVTDEHEKYLWKRQFQTQQK